MRNGVDRHAWEHTAFIAAVLINSNPFRREKKLVQPHEINPHMEKPKDETLRVPMSMVLDIFAPKRK